MQNSIKLAQEFLIKSELSEGGWGYYADSPQAYPEPTCYSILALEGTAFIPQKSLNWLVGLVNADGQLYLPGDDSPNWGTSHLIIALTRLDKFPDQNQLSDEWLIEWKSKYVESTEAVTLDSSLIGWPWISDTFSWVQPTSYAVFALKLVELGSHERVAEALLFDRMCQGGGWNFGNPVILNRPIDPSLLDTAIALFALQGLTQAENEIEMGLKILEQGLSKYSSALVLALGILCMDAFGRPIAHYVDMLVSRQEEDGSWRQMTWWTALAISALRVAEGGGNVFKF